MLVALCSVVGLIGELSLILFFFGKGCLFYCRISYVNQQICVPCQTDGSHQNFEFAVSISFSNNSLCATLLFGFHKLHVIVYIFSTCTTGLA